MVNIFRDFREIEQIVKISSTIMFSPMGVSIGAAMNHEICCLEEALQEWITEVLDLKILELYST